MDYGLPITIFLAVIMLLAAGILTEIKQIKFKTLAFLFVLLEELATIHALLEGTEKTEIDLPF